MKFINKTIQNIANYFNYKISKKVNKYYKNNYSAANLGLIKTKSPKIFDVGSDKGLFIEKFKNIFKNCFIYSFEPNIETFSDLKTRYNSDNKVVINNFGFAEKQGKKKFYISHVSGISSFFKISEKTNFFLRKTSKNNLDILLKKTINVKINTIDNFCRTNKIKHIDVLKIDTEGFEEKVIKGAQKMLKNNKIDIIQIELTHCNVYEKQNKKFVRNSFYGIEKFLIPNNYRLLLIDGSGGYQNLKLNSAWKSELIYISEKIFNNLSKLKKN